MSTTTKKDRARRAAQRVQVNVRLPLPLVRRLQEWASRSGQSATAVITQFIEEGYRMAQFPGIDFRWTPTGRTAHVTGTGLTVWEMLQIWTDHGRNLARARKNYPHLTPVQINAAVSYAETFADEQPGPSSVPAFARKVMV